MEIVAAYTSAWYVRHPDGALSVVSCLPTEPAFSVRPAPVPKMSGEKVSGKKVAEGHE
ncbi:hypothetical protein [Actinoplanes sp. HUAS TT8]|uniref:hypothetical protein n=1 Tax=Actinoplanes sp. HUAS TT8 TaxID=3447453 RepID=UPI003F522B61